MWSYLFWNPEQKKSVVPKWNPSCSHCCRCQDADRSCERVGRFNFKQLHGSSQRGLARCAMGKEEKTAPDGTCRRRRIVTRSRWKLPQNRPGGDMDTCVWYPICNFRFSMHQSVKIFPKVFSISKLTQTEIIYVVIRCLLSRYRHYSLTVKAIDKGQEIDTWRNRALMRWDMKSLLIDFSWILIKAIITNYYIIISFLIF